MEGGDNLAVAQCESGCEGNVGGGERQDRHAIAIGGSGQIGNGVGSFLSIDMVGGILFGMIGGVVDSAHVGGLQLAQFLMGSFRSYQLGPVVSTACNRH